MNLVYVLIAAGIMMGGFGANEASHGSLAEGMGLGHHHMSDYGGYHCAGPDDAHWGQHVDHMHDGATESQDHCGRHHMDRDHEHMGDGSGGPMGPGGMS